jgi:formylglycine-generating enzyme required for sulfatase activity
MAGNVWEWCEDRSSEDKESRVLRGGSWMRHLGYLRVAGRSIIISTYLGRDLVGFRCVSGL